MADVFIVTNESGLNVRSKPDTSASAVMRVMSDGKGFQVFGVFTPRNVIWAGVSRSQPGYALRPRASTPGERRLDCQ